MTFPISNNVADDKFRGSRDFPFKLCIVGGGPSGCSVIVRAVRTGNIERLCAANKESKLSGVCIIDQGSLARFGGGRLQDYSINSNTFAVKFASNVLDDKYESLPPEVCTGTYFEKLRTSENCKRLNEYGNKQGSLKVVGEFLHDVGTTVVETLAQYPATCSCLTDTSVNSVERYVRDDGLIGWKLSILTAGKEPSFIYAKDVLFATGGRQETPTLANSAHDCKVLGSDFVCTDEGIEEVRRRILKSMRTTGKRKVVIVGGSHSAFSAAWMCLHKLDLSVKEDTAPIPSESEYEKPAAHTDTDTDIDTRSCVDPPKSGTSSPAKLSKSPSYRSPNQEPSDDVLSDAQVAATSPSRPIVCKTKEIDKIKQKLLTKSGSTSARGVTGQSDILILHRSYIKVFYSTKREADHDLYNDTGVINKSTGQIHPFGGLRGDSKSLWRDVKCGRENRVRLVALRSGTDVTQQSIGTKLFDEAAIIVWACGYKTNMCPVFESDGVTPIPLGYYRGQVEVDDLARILTVRPQEPVLLPPTPNGTASSANSAKSITRTIERRSSNSQIAVSTDAPRSCEGKSKGGSQDGNTDEEFESHSDRGSRDAYTARATIFKSASQYSSVCDLSHPPIEAAAAVTVTVVEDSVDVIATGVCDTDGLAASRSTTRNGTSTIKHPPSPSSAQTTARLANAAPSPVSTPVGGLLGSGMGFGLKATLDNGEADGSSGRADGVAVYLKHGATLVLAHVLGPSVYGEGITSWEDRTAAMRKLALQVHSRSEPSKVEVVAGSDAEGLDNAYRQRMMTVRSFRVSYSKFPIHNDDPPSPLSHSPRLDRRRSASCCRRAPSPSPSLSIESASSSTRSDLDLASISRLSPPRAFPSSNSAPSTARKSLSQPEAQQAQLSRAAANASAVPTSMSPFPSSFFHRVAALTDQQALGVTRLSAPRSILAKPAASPPAMAMVFLDKETIQASVSRLSTCPARCVALNEAPQPHSEVITKKSSYIKGVTASSDTSTISTSTSTSTAKKSTSSGKEKKIEKMPAQVQPVSPKHAERTSTVTPTTPSRSLPHRRAILQSEALSKDNSIETSTPSSDTVSDPIVEVKPSSHVIIKSEKDRALVSRRSTSVPPTARAVRKLIQVPMPLKPVMIELVLTGMDTSKILRVGLPVTHHAAIGLGAGHGHGAASEESKISWSGAVTEKQKHKRVDRNRIRAESRGTLLSASVPGDYLELMGSNHRVGLPTSRPPGAVDSNASFVEKKIILSHQS